MILKGAEILCVCSGGFEKSVRSIEGLDYMSRLARFAEISAPWLNATKINFAII